MHAVQQQCIPQAILGMDVLCQAKSGMGKTAVFVLSVLQQLEPQEGQVAAVVVCHTRELAFQVEPPIPMYPQENKLQISTPCSMSFLTYSARSGQHCTLTLCFLL